MLSPKSPVVARRSKSNKQSKLSSTPVAAPPTIPSPTTPAATTTTTTSTASLLTIPAVGAGGLLKRSDSFAHSDPLLLDNNNNNNNNNTNNNNSLSSLTSSSIHVINPLSSSSRQQQPPQQQSVLYSLWQKWQRKIPFLKRFQEYILRIPPRVRFGFVIFWFCWKILLTIAFLVVFVRRTGDHDSEVSMAMANTPVAASAAAQYYNRLNQAPIRVLYVVTTLSEYNTGTRATQRGQDRLVEVLIPVLVDGVESMMTTSSLSQFSPSLNIEVDVYLICAFKLLPEREKLIRDSLPEGVGLEVWDNAAPLGYDKRHSPDKIIDNTRALARQHRYVIKDKFFNYDLFLAFEDDMRITGQHIQHYMDMSTEIDRLLQQAPLSLQDVPENLEDVQQTKFYGQMTRQQLSRVVPGFIRVEVLLNETEYGAQTNILPIPTDYIFDQPTTVTSTTSTATTATSTIHHVHPEICCHTRRNWKGLPPAPSANDLIIWETNAKAFSLRQLPKISSPLPPLPSSLSSSQLQLQLDWVVLMMGPGKKLSPEEKIGGYWTGRDGAFGPDEARPSGGVPDLIAQQGGWMATPSQIARMNNGLCMGSFLPPFDQPTYNGDGQESMNVEFWSGSYQFFTGVRGGCNMQRIISMHPDHFSKHLIYHAANNKQRQLDRERMVRADHLFGQLNTVKKMAATKKAAMEGAEKN